MNAETLIFHVFNLVVVVVVRVVVRVLFVLFMKVAFVHRMSFHASNMKK